MAFSFIYRDYARRAQLERLDAFLQASALQRAAYKPQGYKTFGCWPTRPGTHFICLCLPSQLPGSSLAVLSFTHTQTHTCTHTFCHFPSLRRWGITWAGLVMCPYDHCHSAPFSALPSSHSPFFCSQFFSLFLLSEFPPPPIPTRLLPDHCCWLILFAGLWHGMDTSFTGRRHCSRYSPATFWLVLQHVGTSSHSPTSPEAPTPHRVTWRKS